MTKPRKNTVSQSEIEKFDSSASDWWSYEGDFMMLHRMNPVRIRFIRDEILRILPSSCDVNILDVGCGGGLLSIALAKMGYNVTSLDPSELAIKVLESKAIDSRVDDNITTYCGSVEDLITQERHKKFNVVCVMEVVEHVKNLGQFLGDVVKLIEDDGLLIISTINKTVKSLLLAKFMAEYVFRYTPPGTHEWKKFVTPEYLEAALKENNMQLETLEGLKYDILSKSWHTAEDTSVNYILSFVKDSQK